MDGEWDLHAVVRSCATPTTAAVKNTTTVEDYDDGSYNLESLASGKNEGNAFLYPSFVGNPGNVSGGLEDVYKAGCGTGLPAATATTTSGTIDLDVIEGFVHEQLPMLTDSHSFSMHTMNSQSTRTRKRKNQEKRVFQLTQDELSNDLWAWRKYGQKPIKGSPFPRCSTTKACGAKKQVERSPADASIFIVSYSGEHIHPRPTHRSSLAGSTRSNKFNTDNSNKQRPVFGNTASSILEHPPCSSSSPAYASSFSPTTSSKEDECEINDEDEYDEDILIPNTVMNDEILKRFRDLSGGGGSSSRGGGSC